MKKSPACLKSAALLAAMLPGVASAFTISDTFGSFPDATWGGSGIPNDAVAASKQFILGPGGETTIRVAMAATERYSNPAVTDNGAGIYQAGTGSNCGVSTDPVGCPGTGSQGALWNWNYYIDLTGAGDLTDYQIDIWYDLQAGPQRAMGDLSGMGRINITQALLLGGAPPSPTVLEGSQNNLFSFLETGGGAPYITPPGGAFDPNATGNYQFAITVNTGGAFNFPVDAVAIEVNVVPIPAAAWLFGSALLGLAMVKRRKA